MGIGERQAGIRRETARYRGETGGNVSTVYLGLTAPAE